MKESTTKIAADRRNPWPYTSPLGISKVEEIDAFMAPAWSRLGRTPSYPVDTKTAVQLLDALEYRITEEALIKMADEGRCTTPDIVGGELQWDEGLLLVLAERLEVAQQWKRISPRHDVKKSRWRSLVDFSNAVGTDNWEPEFGDMSFERLLVLIALHEDREVREAIRVALEEKYRDVRGY